MVGPLEGGSEELRVVGWVGDVRQVGTFLYLKSG